MRARLYGAAAVMILTVLTPAAVGEEIVYPLSELIGHYEVNELSSSIDFPRAVAQHIYTELDWSIVIGARVVLGGVVTEGLVRGDGVLRPAQEARLLGGVFPWAAFCFGDVCSIPSLAAWRNRTTTEGFFQREWVLQLPDLEAPCVDWSSVDWPTVITRVYPPQTRFYPGPCENPGNFNVSLSSVLTVDLSRMDLPELFDPPEPDELFTLVGAWAEGLEFIEPMTADITEAYLVIETIPEPSVLTLTAATLLTTIGRRRRQGRKHDA